MNKQEYDVVNAIKLEPFINQRILASNTGLSLGKVNQILRFLQNNGYLDMEMRLTEKANREFKYKEPKNAIILAAGYGIRMIPIGSEIPKAMLQVNGEILIERIIQQLLEVNIKDITVIVGFMKEKYEYLIDKYDVKLVVNSEYTVKNNLHSLALVLKRIGNSYIIPSDIWCGINPFSRNELYSWYMVTEVVDEESYVRVNRKHELVKATNVGNQMIGISYIAQNDALEIVKRLTEFDSNKKYNQCFWEEILFSDDKMIIAARVVSSLNVYEINTFEQLRELDASSDQLQANSLKLIANVLNTTLKDIKDITFLKKGMTNRSFCFSYQSHKYIMRIPGEGTDQLINRAEEASVYKLIDRTGISDDIIYIDPQKGYKITKYLEGVRVCDPLNVNDIRKCMKKLREFHELALAVEHEFDIFKQIQFYESLWSGGSSEYKDYSRTKKNVFSLRSYIDAHVDRKVLTHIDAVPDNFLFVNDETGTETIRLIDWEYAGMQDPHVDIAMFCIYALYDRCEVDRLIDTYFPEGCTDELRIKIYCYIAACGLLWSNWCEYKRSLGVEFGEYSLRQYRYAKDYYQIVQNELEEIK